MSKTRSKELNEKIAIIHDILSSYGYIDGSGSASTSSRKKKPYQNIKLLLSNYRALDKVRCDLKHHLENKQADPLFDDTYYRKRYETIDQQLGRLEFALKRIPVLVTPYGELTSNLLYYTYIDPTTRTVSDICAMLPNPVRSETGISTSMYYTHLEKGISMLSNILFNIGDSESECWWDIMNALAEPHK